MVSSLLDTFIFTVYVAYWFPKAAINLHLKRIWEVLEVITVMFLGPKCFFFIFILYSCIAGFKPKCYAFL